MPDECSRCGGSGWVARTEPKMPCYYNCETGGTCVGVDKEYCEHCMNQDSHCDCEAGKKVRAQVKFE